MKTRKAVKRQIRLAILSNAGGSGKTTAAVHLAYVIGVKGYKVTLVELDSNGSIQTFAGLPPAKAESSLAVVLKKGFDGNYPLIPLWSEHVSSIWAIQGGAPLRESVVEINNSERKSQTLRDRLEDYPLESDLIIFDTPASLDTMGLLALAACTHLLAPIKPEYKDTGSFVDLLNWYNEKIRELRLKPRPEILGFVPSRVDIGEEAIHRNLLGLTKQGKPNKKIPPEETLPFQIEQMGIHCFPLIRESSYYLWASGAGLPLHLYRPGCPFIEDFQPLVNAVEKLMTE
ncbi:ParA family protein [Stenomitos frigidus]|uniref:ParA family protein n=1 Tax=Stenomitos frigidus ULC18 TaxID=2107698 RepID=A0A2T1DUC3_9CYAN|nr:ParA family protein [Stenomitos frigidus]PSB24090.1 ParA family protein [Stenomitos frigidus ULC18]